MCGQGCQETNILSETVFKVKTTWLSGGESRWRTLRGRVRACSIQPLCQQGLMKLCVCVCVCVCVWQGGGGIPETLCILVFLESFFFLYKLCLRISLPPLFQERLKCCLSRKAPSLPQPVFGDLEFPPGLSSLDLLSGSTLSCVVTGLLIHSPHIPVLGWTWLVPLTFPGTSPFKYLAVNPHFWVITFLIRSPRFSHTTLRPLPQAGPPHSPRKTAPHIGVINSSPPFHLCVLGLSCFEIRGLFGTL